MKLLLSILEPGSASRVSDAMIAGGFGVTRIDTVGGFLKRGNATLLVGVDDERVDAALTVMRAAYGPPSPNAGGNPVFVVGVDTMVRV
jgi:uncharacterized protein YaaQ